MVEDFILVMERGRGVNIEGGQLVWKYPRNQHGISTELMPLDEKQVEKSRAVTFTTLRLRVLFVELLNARPVEPVDHLPRLRVLGRSDERGVRWAIHQVAVILCYMQDFRRVLDTEVEAEGN